ncbi:hypothetical protein VTL71DRAFT_6863 [Oculimacula yallundae]|uniref:Uncharacterized protein n=1 Tax=Oculimacula yallundae TaxID=86028 RepID=A0ABR4BWI8_9HELO
MNSFFAQKRYRDSNDPRSKNDPSTTNLRLSQPTQERPSLQQASSNTSIENDSQFQTMSCSDGWSDDNDISDIFKEALKDYSLINLPPQAGESSALGVESQVDDSTVLRDAALRERFYREVEIFRPFPKHIKIEEVIYLRSRNALSLPPLRLRWELMQSFAKNGNWQIPRSNLEEAQAALRATVNYNPMEPIKTTSFLLFQAIMLAGLTTVDLKFVKEAGYSSKEEAQPLFFNRVKVRKTVPLSEQPSQLF